MKEDLHDLLTPEVVEEMDKQVYPKLVGTIVIVAVALTAGFLAVCFLPQ